MEDTTAFMNTLCDPLADGAALDRELIGQRLGVLQVRSLLGVGGMGRVYLAWHEDLHRTCAVKVLSGSLVHSDPARLEMFLTEARSAARIHHPHIVAIHSLGSDLGFHFIEMEFVEGSSLQSLVSKHVRLAPPMAIRITSQVASALAAAHAKGVVHSDVKPGNVMVGANLVSKLTDFGLARLHANDAPQTTGRTVGTPAFMAPELFQGALPTPASDAYALGTTLYVLLSGRTPFSAKSVLDWCESHQKGHVPSLVTQGGTLPLAVDELLRQLLRKDPRQRLPCDQDLVRTLERLAGELVDIPAVLHEVASALGAEIRSSAAEWELVVELDQGRRQIVHAELDRTDTGEEMLALWTPCAPRDPQHFEFLLEKNGRLPFGSIALRPWRGQPYFVMVHNHRRSDVDVQRVQRSIHALACWGDQVEHRILGQDIH